ASSPVNQLESVKIEGFGSEKGALSANSIRTVREFLLTYSEPKPASAKDDSAQLTRVHGVGDVLVKLAKLEHR
ncbi:MAG TPA: hypothetical protein VMS31_05845, partial [Pyrinomonadaceae bacterium]|nr:hypothetical protein [Pyrinomonadaceae bacterium]